MEIIGVSLRVVGTSEYFENRDAISHDWLRLLAKYDTTPLLIPNIGTDVQGLLEKFSISGILLTNGNNVGVLKGEVVSEEIDDIWIERDTTEHIMLEFAIKHGIPVLGVCRGMQMLNSYFGGQIVRDLTTICGSASSHVGSSHTVKFIDPDYCRLFDVETTLTNSFHRQAITESTLAADLRSFAVADNGIVEGLYHPELPIIGIQWHPERNKLVTKNDHILLERWLGRR